MAKQKLTKTVVERLRPAASDLIVWDGGLEGFGVRVKPTGVKSYIVQYRNRATGVSKRLTIGQHGPMLTFDQARRQAFGLLADARRGADPADSRRATRDAPTVRQLAADYLERHAIPKKRPKSVRDDRSMLDNIVLPKLGARKVNEVTRRDVEAIHVSMLDRPYQANRVLALLSKMSTSPWSGDGGPTIPSGVSASTTRRSAIAGCRTKSFGVCVLCSTGIRTKERPMRCGYSC